ncbi:phage portal protein [Lacticaseibacillus nasuensis]|uniref:phage portal protein n=1 Tax=Lacticaseibacillus nasuensis TaxID=944671 RepID=UPI002247CFDB|nr:phage portal protein [Lacticaseibacillus nasuensis]MCX2455630.1 phage portal protein [Lacticaseibacillus nasuensis]
MPIFNQVATQPVSGDYSDVLNFALGQSGKNYVSAEVALQNSDIYSAVMQISNDLASMNLTGGSDRLSAFLQNPSATSNGHAFWASVYAQLLLAGESFVYRWRNKNGVDLRWEYLRPSQVQPLLLNDGSGLIYNLSFDEPDVGVMEAVPSGDMLHFRLVSKNGGMTAISPLSALANELKIKDANNKLTLSALGQAVTSPGLLKVTKGGLLNEKQKAARSRTFMQQQHNSSGGPIVIDDLEDYTPLEIKSDVATLLSQTDWTSKQIAKVFGIPDSFLNGQGDQQSSVDQMTGMYTKALNRYALTGVSELNCKLSTHLEADLRPAIDPTGSSYATSVDAFAQSGVLAQNQALYILQQAGYLPDKLPTAKPNINTSMKGGDNNDTGTNQG